MHTSRSASAAQALFRVFVQPALNSPAQSRSILQHIPKRVPRCQASRPYSHTSVRLSKTREPEKRTQKWDEEITAKRLQLVDPETNRLPRDEETGEVIETVRTRYDVLQSYDKKTHRLIQLSVDEPDNRYFIPICKIVSKKDMFDADKKRKVQTKERQREAAKASTVKTLELNWAIDANDLAHRLEKVQDFLGEGRRVEIVLAAKKRGRKATRGECEGVLGRIRETLGMVPGAKELKPLDGKVGGFATLVLQGSGAAAQAQATKESGG